MSLQESTGEKSTPYSGSNGICGLYKRFHTLEESLKGNGQNASLVQHRHEVCVAVPSRNNMCVKMLRNSGAAGMAKVKADIEAVWIERL